jgi:hypothetical protein
LQVLNGRVVLLWFSRCGSWSFLLHVREREPSPGVYIWGPQLTHFGVVHVCFCMGLSLILCRNMTGSSECVQDFYLAHLMFSLPAAKFIIFTKTCDNARKLALMLRNVGLPALPLHGQMTQHKRQGAINKFKAAKESMLFATGESSTCGSRQACIVALSMRPCVIILGVYTLHEWPVLGPAQIFVVWMCMHPCIIVGCASLYSSSLLRQESTVTQRGGGSVWTTRGWMQETLMGTSRKSRPPERVIPMNIATGSHHNMCG